MRAVYRIAVASTIGFALLAAGAAGYYYLYLRPNLNSLGLQDRVVAFLKNPNMPVDQLRGMGLDLREFATGQLVLIEGLVATLVLTCVFAAVLTGYIAYRIRIDRS